MPPMGMHSRQGPQKGPPEHRQPVTEHDTACVTYRCFLPDLTRFVTVCCVAAGRVDREPLLEPLAWPAMAWHWGRCSRRQASAA